MGLQYHRGWPKIRFRGAERLQFGGRIIRRKALEKVVLIRVDAKAPEPTVKL